MVQPKYSPHEALERIKLMMNYDSSKTLNENKKIIFEQNESGTLTDSDLLGNTNLLWQYAQTAADFSIPGYPEDNWVTGPWAMHAGRVSP